MYYSIDIETTGLDPDRHDILEVGIIQDDLSLEDDLLLNLLNNSVDNRPCFRAVIVQPTGDYNTTPFCANMHKDLWDEIKLVEQWMFSSNWEEDTIEWPTFGEVSLLTEGVVWCESNRTHYCTPQTLGWAIKEWLASHGEEVKNGRARITVAGKNFSSFDRQFLENDFHRVHEDVEFRHRSIDPGSMYMTKDDTTPPGMDECLKRAGIEPIPELQHRALYDAYDVVRLVRCKLLA